MTKKFLCPICKHGEWGLSYGKIEMYWSHEGDVLTNVHYCPFCGIKFEVKQQGR